MNDKILEKIDEVNDALDESFGSMDIDDTAQTMEEGLADMRRSMSANAAAMMKLMSEDSTPPPISSTPNEMKNDPWFQKLAKYLATMRELRITSKRSSFCSATTTLLVAMESNRLLERSSSIKA